MKVSCKGFYDIHLHPGPDVSHENFQMKKLPNGCQKRNLQDLS